MHPYITYIQVWMNIYKHIQIKILGQREGCVRIPAAKTGWSEFDPWNSHGRK